MFTNRLIRALGKASKYLSCRIHIGIRDTPSAMVRWPFGVVWGPCLVDPVGLPN
jgi:hypothetical protein